MNESNAQLKKLLDALDNAQLIDIVVIDVRNHTTITDYMIIGTGRSSRHVTATAHQIMEQMKCAHLPSINQSGVDEGDWALLDFGDFIVHIMQADTRAFYNLEGLWQERIEQ